MIQEEKRKKKNRAHVLKGNKGKEKPNYYVFFDSEARVDPDTMEHNSYLICACFIDKRYQKESWKDYVNDAAGFWTDVADFGGDHAVYVYAHNMSYDLMATGGIPILVDCGYRVTSFFQKGMTFILRAGKRVGKKTKTINFISSTNYYPQALKQLGEIFGLPKLDFDYQGGPLEEAIPYCRRDVEIAKTAVEHFIDFVEKEDLGVLAKTTPGQAFNAYRHRFMSTKITLHSNEAAIALEREAYSGGRVECWRLGKYQGHFYGYDVNSMYPYVMRKYQYPTELSAYYPEIAYDIMKTFIDNGLCVIAKCHVKVDKPYIGIKLGKNSLFPVGDFWATLCTPEIAFLLDKGMIIDVKDCALYQAGNIFKDYVDYFYSRKVGSKAAGDKIHESLYKLFLNSLYGKFGQRSEEFRVCGTADPKVIGVETVWYVQEKREVTFKTFGGSIFMSQEEDEGYNAFCAIAAHVTAYARMTLLRYIETAGWDNVIYMDTDSLFVTEEGSRNLMEAGCIDSKELGKMKLEKEGDIITINAPKDYSFAGETKRKGISKNAMQITDNSWEVVQFPGLNTFIRQGQLSKFYNVKHIKKLKREYYKGWLLDDGRVMPLELVDNVILPWKETGYSRHGLLPWDISIQEEIMREKFREDFADTGAIMAAAYEERNNKKVAEKEKKNFRKIVLMEGGICDPDYEYIPRWARRRAGRRLDELVLPVQEAGYHVENADDLYKLLGEVSSW